MSIQQIIIWIFTIAAAFSCGGIMFCRILPKLFKKIDICALSPDGNPGAANVFTYCGIKLGILCLIMDLAKGFLPVYTAYKIFSSENLLFSLVISAPVLGHAVSPFDGKSGGKCIATSFGVLLALLPTTKAVFLLAGIYIFFSVIIKINPNSKRSIITFSIFGLISFVFLMMNGNTPAAIGCGVISAISVVKHLKIFEHIPVHEAIQC